MINIIKHNEKLVKKNKIFQSFSLNSSKILNFDSKSWNLEEYAAMGDALLELFKLNLH